MTKQEVNQMMINWMMQFTNEFNQTILKHYNEITTDKSFLILLVRWNNEIESYNRFKKMDLENVINAVSDNKEFKMIETPYPSDVSSMMQRIVMDWEKF